MEVIERINSKAGGKPEYSRSQVFLKWKIGINSDWRNEYEGRIKQIQCLLQLWQET